MQQVAVDHGAAADAGTDRQIHEGIHLSGRAPAVLAQRGDVDIGVEADRHVKLIP